MIVQRYHMQQCIAKKVLTEEVRLHDAHKKGWCWQKLSISTVQTRVINCNNAYKSCHLQFLHTEAIAALTQFFDFCKYQVQVRL